MKNNEKLVPAKGKKIKEKDLGKWVGQGMEEGYRHIEVVYHSRVRGRLEGDMFYVTDDGAHVKKPLSYWRAVLELGVQTEEEAKEKWGEDYRARYVGDPSGHDPKPDKLIDFVHSDPKFKEVAKKT